MDRRQMTLVLSDKEMTLLDELSERRGMSKTALVRQACALRLVVLGQAKCIKPDSSISPDQVARLVARLRRGGGGVFVTTGGFSHQAQVEIVDDAYPVVLVSGGRLASTVRRIVHESYDGDVQSLLREVADTYESHITHRRPEEALTTA